MGTEKFNEQKIDRLIKHYVRMTADFKSFSIEPSDDFMDRVMMKINRINNTNNITSTIILVILSLMPFAVRIIWDYIRGDYFSLVSMPMGSYLSNIYHIFMTTSSAYALLILGIGMAYIFINKNKDILHLTSR